MLAWLKRKLSFSKGEPRPPVEVEPAAPEPVRRNRQQNIKVSADCAAIFEALARKEGVSKSDFFEDMVEERYERARRQGFEINGSND